MDTTITITGSTGFVGRNLRRHLQLDGRLWQGIPREALEQNGTSLSFQPHERVVHLAAQTFVPDSWTRPEEFYRCNVMGTMWVLEAARQAQVPVTYLSSYVYGIPQYLPIDEKHPVLAQNPYMHSKLMAEDLCRFYRKQYGVQVCILRPFNIYGPGQPSQFLIPTIFHQVTDPEVNEIRLHALTPRRDYVHIDDVVEAIVASLDQPCSATLNVASGESYSVSEVVDQLQLIYNTEKPVKSSDYERPNEIPDTRADISAAASTLNWRPKLSLAAGLRTLGENRET